MSDDVPREDVPGKSRSWTSEEAYYHFLDDMQKRRDKEVVGLSWPVEWPSIQSVVGPIEPGSLTIVASRPSVGKTMFAMQLLRHLAKLGKRLLFVSRELNVVRLVRRHIVAFGGNIYHLRSGDLLQTDLDAMNRYQDESKGWKVFYDDHSRTVASIEAEVERREPECIIIDYLQRLAYDTEKEYAAITRISNELQDLTLSTGVPVVCLSQLGRPEKGKENHPPVMSDTRGSGAVEERAANMILLHREWDVDEEHQFGSYVKVPKSPSNNGFAIIAKSADGESGRFIPMLFEGHRMRIIEREERSWVGL